MLKTPQGHVVFKRYKSLLYLYVIDTDITKDVLVFL